MQDFAAVERGRYLATAADCGSCHTVPGSDQPFGGGRPIETPFGVLAAPNITPDRETGIGDWTDDEFDAAVRHGVSRNGARLYPAMPFPYYSRMSREDVKDIRAYLSTIEPVHNAVRVNRLPFPFNIRASMIVWDELYFTPGEFHPERVQIAGMESRRLSGAGPGALRRLPHAEDLSGRRQDRPKRCRAIRCRAGPRPTSPAGRARSRNWSAEDVATYLKTGHNRHAAAAGLMGEVVDLSTSKMTDDDVKAIAAYLKDVSGPAQEDAAAPDKDVLTAGGAIYQDLCSACHAQDGKGVPNLFPNLAEAATVKAKDPDHGAARDPAGRAERRDRPRADRSRHAGLRLAAQRCADRGGRDLCPQSFRQGAAVSEKRRAEGASDARGADQLTASGHRRSQVRVIKSISPSQSRIAEPEQSGAGKDEGAWPALPQFHEDGGDDRRFDRADRQSATTALNAPSGTIGERHRQGEQGQQAKPGDDKRERGTPSPS